MDKIISLREHLLDRVPGLKNDPDRLLIFVGKGKVISNSVSLSFQYEYTVNVIITDFNGHADSVMIPVLAWYKRNQPDKIFPCALSFEAEILNHQSVDLSVDLDLTENVIVTQDNEGNVSSHHHCPEPEIDTRVTSWPAELFVNGETS